MMATTFALTLSLAGALGYDLLGLKGFKGRGCAAGGAALYQPQGYFLAGKALFSHGTRMQASIAVITISGSM